MSADLSIPYLLVVRWPVGGIRTHLKYGRDLLTAMPHYALIPTLVAFDDQDTRLAVSSLGIDPKNDRSQGIHSLFGMAQRIFRLSLNSKFHVVHSQGFISSVLSSPATVLLRKRHIVSVHDVITDDVIESTSYISRLVLGVCLRLAYAVHAVGEDCARSIRQLPLMRNARNIIIIKNGIDPKRFTNPVSVDLRTLIGVPKYTKLIGFFGRFHPQKGFRYLIDALEQLKFRTPELAVHVVAAGNAGTLDEDKAYAGKKGLTGMVSFVPQAENPASFMAACDMIVMPSLFEAYSLLAAEVLTLGIPLIASDCIGLKEVTADTPARSFPAKNTEALTKAIQEELEHPSIEAARAFVPEARKRFDFTHSALLLNRLLFLAHSGRPLCELY